MHHRTVLLNGQPIGYVVYPGWWVSGLDPTQNIELCSWEQANPAPGYVDCVPLVWAPAGTTDAARCPGGRFRPCQPGGPRQNGFTGAYDGWR